MFCHFVAEHNLAPLVADHFTDLVKKMFPQCTVAKEFACKRMKTTMVIKDTLAPHYTLPINGIGNFSGSFHITLKEDVSHQTSKDSSLWTCNDAEGAHPDPRKRSDISTKPSPTNVKELQQFLGLV
ncbi:hypothetical protein PoB_002642600 [Plakobranchus ocellatus]|uniref:Uncharacterized protein n=1 Tax=Plakobranchus ocellatus TaxID=259542 RepID=A0AAV3ZLC7_9GAST|nr:hypothetical protein PoB_002642600 [Plakobranchus ocellatus]